MNNMNMININIKIVKREGKEEKEGKEEEGGGRKKDLLLAIKVGGGERVDERIAINATSPWQRYCRQFTRDITILVTEYQPAQPAVMLFPPLLIILYLFFSIIIIVFINYYYLFLLFILLST